MLHHFERNVKPVETSRDWWHQHVSKICLCRMKMKFCLEKSTFSFGVSQKVNNNTPQAKRFLNFNIFCRKFTTFSYIIRPSHTMRKKPRKKLLSSSYILIRNKTYINFVLAEMMHFILNIEKASLEKLFWVIECYSYFKHQKLIQTEKAMPRLTCCK